MLPIYVACLRQHRISVVNVSGGLILCLFHQVNEIRAGPDDDHDGGSLLSRVILVSGFSNPELRGFAAR